MYIYKTLSVNVIVKLPHPRSGDSQSQETFLEPSANKQNCNYDTEYSFKPPLLSINPEAKLEGLTHRKMKW